MLSHRLEEPPPCRERLIPPVGALLFVNADSRKRAQVRLDPRRFTSLGNQSGDLFVKLVMDRVCAVAFEDSGLSLDDLRERAHSGAASPYGSERPRRQ